MKEKYLRCAVYGAGMISDYDGATDLCIPNPTYDIEVNEVNGLPLWMCDIMLSMMEHSPYDQNKDEPLEVSVKCGEGDEPDLKFAEKLLKAKMDAKLENRLYREYDYIYDRLDELQDKLADLVAKHYIRYINANAKIDKLINKED